ncbi:hypothetical protein EHS25_001578 [Saitozyma podzolica]|uniref:NADH:flavin oxidoreductase/NADH oxidase N-terminal domain-containing protein n=1 Tax=Saitozyma podzolica TaxID=1890683 RepID=A0A427YH29_9TREE|nr:hypothetical protein EHS25_001578 [Saitozyma podzolica]
MPVVDLSTLPPLERAEKSLLFQPLTLGSMTVKHRIALAPLTRNRGKPSSTVKGTWYPWQIQEDYYVQPGKGMVNVPGIWTQEQKDAWKPIVKNVKKAGAVFVAQLFHGGRAAGHGLERAVSSSATRVENTLGGGPGDVPDEMTLDDIKRTIDDYVQSAKNAIEAGFDGVEIHGGNGYRESAKGRPALRRLSFPSSPLPLFPSSPLPLFPSSPLHLFTSSPLPVLVSSSPHLPDFSPPRLLYLTSCLSRIRHVAPVLTRTPSVPDQFLHSNINKRTDAYGGSIENRNRFVLELCDAVASAIGPEKFGLRLAPYGFFNETRGESRTEQWKALCEALAPKGYAYIHFMEARYDEVLSEKTKLSQLGKEMSSDFDVSGLPTIAPFREVLGGVGGTPVIVAGGYDTENCWDTVDSGRADMIAFGRYFTSNPIWCIGSRTENRWSSTEALLSRKWSWSRNRNLACWLGTAPLTTPTVRPLFYMFPEDRYHEGYTDFANHEDNLVTLEDKALYDEHSKRGIVIAKPGWQLSQDGVQ